MFQLPRVLRTFYKKLRQGNIPKFVKSILLKMENNPTYADLADAVAQLKAALELYELLLAESESRDKQKIEDKNLAKANVLLLLDELSDGVEYYGKQNLPYYIGTGLPLQTGKTSHVLTDLLIPINFTATSSGQPGGARISYNIDPSQRSIIKMVGVEWSLDLEIWNNGKFSGKKKFTVSGMPSSQKIYMRIKAIASDGRVSQYTEPVLVSIL